VYYQGHLYILILSVLSVTGDPCCPAHCTRFLFTTLLFVFNFQQIYNNDDDDVLVNDKYITSAQQ